MYTPFRLNPRIFPAVVSATVAASEAMTVFRPQVFVVDFVFVGTCAVGCAKAVAGKMTEPANPAPRVAMAPMKERRSLNGGPDSRFSRFFDVVSASHLGLSNGALHSLYSRSHFVALFYY
jgi:hypothetical protein